MGDVQARCLERRRLPGRRCRKKHHLGVAGGVCARQSHQPTSIGADREVVRGHVEQQMRAHWKVVDLDDHAVCAGRTREPLAAVLPGVLPQVEVHVLFRAMGTPVPEDGQPPRDEHRYENIRHRRRYRDRHATRVHRRRPHREMPHHRSTIDDDLHRADACALEQLLREIDQRIRHNTGGGRRRRSRMCICDRGVVPRPTGQ
mmetsp:Transcript_43158/g.125712  ORF Transcript_43158/g.125712 Transcript_43158/m.125712 type:complete len:202 (-) Transcript_43158:255-860(-)